MLKLVDQESIEYDLYRSACIKEFEIILEQSAKLLRKALKPYFESSRIVDQLIFKDVFRNALQRNMINAEACERWLAYRDHRNSTAQDYGLFYAEETLLILAEFSKDAADLVA